MNLKKHSLKLHASPRAVIAQFLILPGAGRVANVINRVKLMPDDIAVEVLNKVYTDFKSRHRDIDQIFWAHFKKAGNQYNEDLTDISETKKKLIGAYFTKEYSIQAAALFNPSIVAHPMQDGLQPGEKRFVMSLRATGEGHISSIVFHTGIINSEGVITLDAAEGYFTSLSRKEEYLHDKEKISNLLTAEMKMSDFDEKVFSLLPPSFSTAELSSTLGS